MHKVLYLNARNQNNQTRKESGLPNQSAEYHKTESSPFNAHLIITNVQFKLVDILIRMQLHIFGKQNCRKEILS